MSIELRCKNLYDGCNCNNQDCIEFNGRGNIVRMCEFLKAEINLKIEEMNDDQN